MNEKIESLTSAVILLFTIELFAALSTDPSPKRRAGIPHSLYLR